MTKLVAPGPRVERHTPGLPVNLPIVAAIKPADCSWRVGTNLMGDLRRLSKNAKFSSPGTPKTYSTPSLTRVATNISAAVIVFLTIL